MTGNLLAGGPLRTHEEELLRAAGLGVTPGTARKPLNPWHLTDDGLASLADCLESGRYDVRLPEEGALLVAALLVSHGESKAARELLDEIGGYFEKLRFYPTPSASSAPGGTDVYLWNVGEVAASVADRKPNGQIDAQREAVEVWTPLVDKLIRLILETVDGNTPFRRISEDWTGRAEKLVAEFADAEANHRRCKKPHKTKSNFSQLRAY